MPNNRNSLIRTHAQHDSSELVRQIIHMIATLLHTLRTPLLIIMMMLRSRHKTLQQNSHAWIKQPSRAKCPLVLINSRTNAVVRTHRLTTLRYAHGRLAIQTTVLILNRMQLVTIRPLRIIELQYVLLIPTNNRFRESRHYTPRAINFRSAAKK